jgi:hypothetical protein
VLRSDFVVFRCLTSQSCACAEAHPDNKPNAEGTRTHPRATDVQKHATRWNRAVPDIDRVPVVIAAAGDIGVREVSRTATYRTTATHRSATAWYDGILLKFTQRFLK